MTRKITHNEKGFIRGIGLCFGSCIVLFGIFNLYSSASAQYPTAIPEYTSTIEGYCLDDHDDSRAANAVVDSWRCNGSPAQSWFMKGQHIVHDTQCLDVQDNGTAASDPVIAANCSNTSGENWTIDLGGLQNTNSGLCLAIPDSQTDQQLELKSCNNLGNLNLGWSATYWSDPSLSAYDCGVGSEGQRVACEARIQWMVWQKNGSNHNNLLNTYSDGNGYEEWCADFVSYVYQQAGYPFRNGERDGWDEYNANNVVNIDGFTEHPAGSYLPKPGDIAYFNYPGGHVEVVVVGGKNPTFIYGDSGTTDPSTQNGEMNEDTLTSDGSVGGVEYYLSPNS